jgi:hypothetical protein
MRVSRLPAIVTHEYLPNMLSAPLSNTRVAHLSTTVVHVPPGRYNDFLVPVGGIDEVVKTE